MSRDDEQSIIDYGDHFAFRRCGSFGCELLDPTGLGLRLDGECRLGRGDDGTVERCD